MEGDAGERVRDGRRHGGLVSGRSSERSRAGDEHSGTRRTATDVHNGCNDHTTEQHDARDDDLDSTILVNDTCFTPSSTPGMKLARS